MVTGPALKIYGLQRTKFSSLLNEHKYNRLFTLSPVRMNILHTNSMAQIRFFCPKSEKKLDKISLVR